MRNKLAVLVLSLSVGVAFAAAPVKKVIPPAVGTLKIKAGYVLNNGEVRPLADKSLFISKVPFSKYKTKFENVDFAAMPYRKTPDFDPVAYMNPSPACASLTKLNSVFRSENKMVMILEKLAVNQDHQRFIADVIQAGGAPTCDTDLTGQCSAVKLPAGSYYIVSGPVTSGPSFFGWDLPVRIEPGKTTYIELKNSNMADLTPVSDKIRRNCDM